MLTAQPHDKDLAQKWSYQQLFPTAEQSWKRRWYSWIHQFAWLYFNLDRTWKRKVTVHGCEQLTKEPHYLLSIPRPFFYKIHHKLPNCNYNLQCRIKWGKVADGCEPVPFDTILKITLENTGVCTSLSLSVFQQLANVMQIFTFDASGKVCFGRNIMTLISIDQPRMQKNSLRFVDTRLLLQYLRIL